MSADKDILFRPPFAGGVKRILSLDGGGIRGTCPAAFLAALEEDLPDSIGKYFDLITGTSTGAILALGLAMGIPAKELHALYVEKGPQIFGRPGTAPIWEWFLSHILLPLKHAFAPKHDADNLRAAIAPILQGLTIGDAQTRLVIPAWDADLKSVYLYKTAHHPRFTTDHKKPALDAAMGSSAAPTYFKRHRTSDDIGLIDGGVWANNPTAIAVVEAISVLGWPADSLRVLSLGCIDEVYMLPESPGIVGLPFFKKGLGPKIINLMMDGQSRGALGMAKLLTKHGPKHAALYRIDAQAPANFFSLDDTTKIQRLSGIGAAMARREKPNLMPVFFDQLAAPFIPSVSQIKRKKAS